MYYHGDYIPSPLQSVPCQIILHLVTDQFQKGLVGGRGWGGGVIMGSERVIHRPLRTAGLVTAHGSVSVRGCGL